eukprot:TRINITY_DN4107_c0_g1_i2.p1 TRINITY_DN4107_c0_g1~~TRINITY_DN4107_c0_g1_i2.p1  ORF type:complete len:252 (+),score=56.55 TRINITY_DN4107_c0_g1_i2:155-910(+)
MSQGQARRSISVQSIPKEEEENWTPQWADEGTRLRVLREETPPKEDNPEFFARGIQGTETAARRSIIVTSIPPEEHVSARRLTPFVKMDKEAGLSFGSKNKEQSETSTKVPNGATPFVAKLTNQIAQSGLLTGSNDSKEKPGVHLGSFLTKLLEENKISTASNPGIDVIPEEKLSDIEASDLESEASEEERQAEKEHEELLALSLNATLEGANDFWDFVGGLHKDRSFKESNLALHLFYHELQNWKKAKSK